MYHVKLAVKVRSVAPPGIAPPAMAPACGSETSCKGTQQGQTLVSETCQLP